MTVDVSNDVPMTCFFYYYCEFRKTNTFVCHYSVPYPNLSLDIINTFYLYNYEYKGDASQLILVLFSVLHFLSFEKAEIFFAIRLCFSKQLISYTAH